MIIHTVVFRLRHEVGSAAETAFFKASAKLTHIPEVQNWEYRRQVSMKNDYTYGFSMEFADAAAYGAYSDHPDHVAYVRDVWAPNVVDFLELDFERFDPVGE